MFLSVYLMHTVKRVSGLALCCNQYHSRGGEVRGYRVTEAVLLVVSCYSSDPLCGPLRPEVTPCGNHQKHVFFFNFFIFLLVSSCGPRYDSKAFLFSLVNKPGWAPVKLTQTGQHSSSTYSYSSYGPTFGGGYDIYISDKASSNTGSYTNLGHDYAAPSGYSHGNSFTQTFLAATYNFQPDEIETFYETT